MDIASAGGSPLIQQQAMQYGQADKQTASTVSQTQASTPQASLEAAPAPNAATIPGMTRVGGSIDTYA